MMNCNQTKKERREETLPLAICFTNDSTFGIELEEP